MHLLFATNEIDRNRHDMPRATKDGALLHQSCLRLLKATFSIERASSRSLEISHMDLESQVVGQPVMDNPPVSQNVLPEQGRDIFVMLGRSGDVYEQAINLKTRLFNVSERQKRRFSVIFDCSAYTSRLGGDSQHLVGKAFAIHWVQRCHIGASVDQQSHSMGVAQSRQSNGGEDVGPALVTEPTVNHSSNVRGVVSRKS